MKSKLEWALYFASLGYYVFPLVPNGKLPLEKGWLQNATRDPDKIKAAWKKYPDANIGAVTGKFADDKALLVVDVDNKNGVSGDKTIIGLELDGKDFPRTAMNMTASGGRHIIYTSAEAVKQGAGVLGEGLDIRSRGGFIVMGGSVVDGKPYTYKARPIAASPSWLFSKLAVATTRTISKSIDDSKINPDLAYQRAVKLLENAPPPSAGSRNNDYFALACKLKDTGVLEEVALDLLVEYNDCAEDPLEFDELAKVVHSGYENGQRAFGSKAPEAVLPDIEAVTKSNSPLDIINRDFAFCIIGGIHQILWNSVDESGNPRVSLLSETAFHKMLAAKTIQLGDGKTHALSKLWMSDPDRRTYEGMVYAPGRQVNSRYYNLWRGWPHKPYGPGEAIPAKAQQGFDLYIEHALNNVCGGDTKLFGWLMARCAMMYQQPERKILTAVCLRGGKGVGKNSFFEPLVALFGPNGLIADDRRYLVGNFNSFMEVCSLLVLDEAAWPGDKESEGRLKGLITGTDHNIERKGIEPYKARNLTNVFISGNEDWLVPATADERRFAAYDVEPNRKQDTSFFRKMAEGMKAGGYRLLMEYFLSYDCSPYDVNVAPPTQALIEQKHASLDILDQYILDCLHLGYPIGVRIPGVQLTKIPVDLFREGLVAYSRNRNVRVRLPDERTMEARIKKILPSMKRKALRYGTEIKPCYLAPSVDQLRRDWERFIGAPEGLEWGSDDTDDGELECLK